MKLSSLFAKVTAASCALLLWAGMALPASAVYSIPEKPVTAPIRPSSAVADLTEALEEQGGEQGKRLLLCETEIDGVPVTVCEDRVCEIIYRKKEPVPNSGPYFVLFDSSRREVYDCTMTVTRYALVDCNIAPWNPVTYTVTCTGYNDLAADSGRAYVDGSTLTETYSCDPDYFEDLAAQAQDGYNSYTENGGVPPKAEPETTTLKDLLAVFFDRFFTFA